MDKRVAIMELVAGYGTYADARELGIDAVADAPETTWACVIVSARISSEGCARVSVAVSVSATVELGC